MIWEGDGCEEGIWGYLAVGYGIMGCIYGVGEGRDVW